MKMGRKNWILIGNVVEIVGSIISATSYSYGQLGKYKHVLDDPLLKRISQLPAESLL